MEIFWFIIGGLFMILFIFLKAKSIQHKIFLIVLIVLIVFFYISYVKLIANQGINLNNSDGLIKAGEIYLSWLSGIFKTAQGIGGKVINENWTEGLSFNKTDLDLGKASRR